MPATFAVDSYELTAGVMVEIDPMIFLLSPLDAPMLTGVDLEGLPMITSDSTTQTKFEWQDERLNVPRSSLAALNTAATTFLTLPTGERVRFGTGDGVIVGDELMRVTGYGTTADTLTVARGFGGTVAASGNTGDEIVGVGTLLPEGSDPENMRLVDRVRDWNYTQIYMSPEIRLTGTAVVIPRYGVPSEWAHQVLRRDQEMTIAREQSLLYGVRYETADLAIRSTGGLKQYLVSNIGTGTSLTVSTIEAAQVEVYDEGGFADILIANPKRLVGLNDLNNTNVVRVDRMDTGRGRSPVTYVDTEYGRTQIVRHRRMRMKDAFGVSSDKLRRRPLRPMVFEMLAKTGDAQKAFMVCEEGWEVTAEEHMLRFNNLTA